MRFRTKFYWICSRSQLAIIVTLSVFLQLHTSVFKIKVTYFQCDYYHPQRSWGKVIFSQASVILLTGGGVSAPRGVCSWGVSAPRGCVCSRGCLLLGGFCSQGGCLVETPRDGHCCGRYASYWNAFLLTSLNTCFTVAKNNRGCETFENVSALSSVYLFANSRAVHPHSALVSCHGPYVLTDKVVQQFLLTLSVLIKLGPFEKNFSCTPGLSQLYIIFLE